MAAVPTSPLTRGLAPALVSLALALALAAPAGAQSVQQEEREGGQILRSVQDETRDCKDLSNDDFERVGEYAMGRMAGSTQAHESMNALMRSMMGARGEEQMHVYLGRRFTGCGGGSVPAGFGNMMGAMGMMGGAGFGDYGSGPRGGPGYMMGGPDQGPGIGPMRAADSDDDDPVAMIVVMVALIGLAGAGLWLLRPARGRPTGGGASALDILASRYASGEMDTDEYERRRQALGGTA